MLVVINVFAAKLKMEVQVRMELSASGSQGVRNAPVDPASILALAASSLMVILAGSRRTEPVLPLGASA